ncbi:hypothetical protein HNP84_006714 [Thermocatellispora tengchongensis]|uniref:Uncharacterized protein n=1 Tax=Thermocatellispora tengchongensis TaxID=1073253 RepID=A0A840PCJ8_9ACTN|nr:hypothetical protein [Thermocatellispora tengchongensis]MBB5136962.1 hypothetical protein [Thermocatellispora tengchongensis]
MLPLIQARTTMPAEPPGGSSAGPGIGGPGNSAMRTLTTLATLATLATTTNDEE